MMKIFRVRRCGLLGLVSLVGLLAFVESSAASELSLTTGRIIYQRNSSNQADVAVTGTCDASVTRIKARVVPMQQGQGTASEWREYTVSGGSFDTKLQATGGWYKLEVQAVNGVNAGQTAYRQEVGVGEVFITAGQSNSTNAGTIYNPVTHANDPAPVTNVDPRVCAATYDAPTNTLGWRQGYDPQPIIDGTGASAWSTLGDRLVGILNVPVGFMSIGVGSTAVEQWALLDPNDPPTVLPPGPTGVVPELKYYYQSNMKKAIDLLSPTGFCGILWHQGEADARDPFNTTTAKYVARMERLIAATRSEELGAGWDVPWAIALASYRPDHYYSQYPNLPEEGFDVDIRNAQLAVIANDSLVYQGANTDVLIDGMRESAGSWGLHLNQAGAIAHGEAWVPAALQLAAVPEPSSVALMAIGGASLALGWRRHRAK